LDYDYVVRITKCAECFIADLVEEYRYWSNLRWHENSVEFSEVLKQLLRYGMAVMLSSQRHWNTTNAAKRGIWLLIRQ